MNSCTKKSYKIISSGFERPLFLPNSMENRQSKINDTESSDSNDHEIVDAYSGTQRFLVISTIVNIGRF